MIYITGDTHGEYNDLINRIRSYKPSADDTVIVCGDFGFVWDNPCHCFMLAKLTAVPFNIAFIDGNHEDFTRLNSYPVEEWNGGKVHRIAPNIVHLMRGQLFTIEGKTFFTMGGAYSIDKALRKEGVSWWAEELPNSDDYKTAGETLEKCGYTVDYVITHTVPESVIYCMGLVPDIHDIELTTWLECLYGKLDFKKWFAGHFHRNSLVNNIQILYKDVEVIQ